MPRHEEVSVPLYAMDPRARLVAVDERTTIVRFALGARRLAIPRAAIAAMGPALGRFVPEPVVAAAAESVVEPSATAAILRQLTELGVVYRKEGRSQELPASLGLAPLSTVRRPLTGPLAGAVLLGGEGALAERIVPVLRRRWPFTSEVRALDGALDDTRARPRRWRSLLRGVSIVVHVEAEPSMARVCALKRLCDERDVFLLLVGSAFGTGIRVGPMLAPATTGHFEATFDPDGVGLVEEPARRRQRHTRPGHAVLSRACDAIARVLGTPTLPLLWEALEILPSSSRALSLPRWSYERASSTSERLSIMRIINPAVAGVRRRLRGSLTAGRLVSIADALDHDFAAATWRALDETRAWKLHGHYEDGFHYHQHNIYAPHDFPPAIKTCQLVFSSTATKRWVASISGRGCGGAVSLSPSWYTPGDHNLPHYDHSGARQVAFVWHLTRGWHPAWGGQLLWCPTGALIPPGFNVLHLFAVSRESLHSVCVVAPIAAAKRLAVSGWWNSPDRVDLEPTRSRKRTLCADGSITEYR